jgi:hypothetical protein
MLLYHIAVLFRLGIDSRDAATSLAKLTAILIIQIDETPNPYC